MKSNEIIQISPNHLSDKYPGFNKQVKRIFYIPEAVKNSIFIVDSSKKYLNKILIQKFKHEYYPLIIQSCDESSSSVSFSPDPKNTKLEYKSTTKTYPSPIVFLDLYSYELFKSFCFKGISEDIPILNLDITISTTDSFIWNFNMYNEANGKKSNISYVYSIQQKDASIPKFNFNNFAWPIANLDVVYISIYQTASNKYSTQVVFFKKDGQLFNILNNKNITKAETANLPFKFIYSKKSTGKNLIDLSFSNFDAVYLSHTEIVYQVEIPEFKKCNPSLIIENENTIRVWCMSWYNIEKNPIPFESTNFTLGLDVVKIQGNPINFGENKSSSDLNNNRKRVARALV